LAIWGRIISQFKRQKEKLLILCSTIYYIIMMFEGDFDIIVESEGLVAQAGVLSACFDKLRVKSCATEGRQ
jgi:hypothetical protein